VLTSPEQYQVRFAPGLAAKPTPQASSPEQTPPKTHKPDPFDLDNVSEHLRIFDDGNGRLECLIGEDHFLVLNKYPISPRHFILATKKFIPQTNLLEAEDLWAAYNCILDFDKFKEDLFVFYNSGRAAGASQPHRHMQLIPVESMRRGLETAPNGTKWEVHSGKDRPFPHFKCNWNPEDLTAAGLHSVYLRLYSRARQCLMRSETLERSIRAREKEAGIQGAMIDYNLTLSKHYMEICPRVRESGRIRSDADDDDPNATISFNGTLLGGTALVKSKAVWESLRRNPEGLQNAIDDAFRDVPKLPPEDDSGPRD
jgi:sulfate adenylyltransferase (ADP) / ATP adenylyltransferase